MSLLLQAYKQALKLLPPTYREHYAEPMTQTLEDMLQDQQSSFAKSRILLRALADLPITASYQYVQEGGATMNHMPTYAKGGTLAAAVLLLPFFILITMNAVHPLGESLQNLGYIGVFILPIVALGSSLSLLIQLLVTKKLSLSPKRLQSNWMLFVVPVLALGIVAFAFGHDNVHCIIAGNPHQIMECVGRG